MKQVIIFKDPGVGAMIDRHQITTTMADCFINQYRIYGWHEEKTVSPNLYIFTKTEKTDIERFIKKIGG